MSKVALMKKSKYAKLIALVCMLVHSPIFASVIYSDVILFNSALGARVVDDYQSAGYGLMLSNEAMSAVLGETRYKSITWDNQNMVSTDGRYCSGCNGTFLLDFTSTSVTQGSGVYGVGFEYFNYGEPLLDAFVTYGDGTFEWFSLQETSSEKDDLKFWGATSALKISSIFFGLESSIGVEDSGFGIDNLTIGASINPNVAFVVPEPSAFWLMLLGLLSLNRSRSALRRAA